MQIHSNFVTPLWTGDADGKANRVQITGLLGSLRWWYEALVRGVGGYACDPTGDQRCSSDAGLCAACQVFGATGQAKAFEQPGARQDGLAAPLWLKRRCRALPPRRKRWATRTVLFP